MRKEALNKRGQELSITTIILIIIGIVVLVVIIIGFTQGTDFFFDKLNFLPGQTLESFVQACSIAGQSGLTADYCKSFKKVELNKQKMFVNCQYDEVENLIDSDKRLSESKCGTESENAKKQCGDLRVQKGDSFSANKIIVNGISCADRGVTSELKSCDDLGGVELPSSPGCSADSANPKRTEILTRGNYKETDSTKICCVYKTCSQLNGKLIEFGSLTPDCSDKENKMNSRESAENKNLACCVNK